MVVKEVTMSLTREIEVQATPEEVWEALATEEGRERWLQEPEREIHVEHAQAPHRLVWWWASDEQPATRVEFLILAGTELRPSTRVIVTESMPAGLPLALLAASLQLVAA
jgi:uncharacterized protein YndB with AHSA1/START domain